MQNSLPVLSKEDHFLILYWCIVCVWSCVTKKGNTWRSRSILHVTAVPLPLPQWLASTMHVESLPQKTSCWSTGNIEVSKGSPINSWWFSGSVMPKTDATESTSIHECLSKVKVSPVLDSSFQILPVAFPAFWGESPAFKMPTNMEDSFRGALTMVGNWKVWPGPTPVHVYRSTLFKVYCLEL